MRRGNTQSTQKTGNVLARPLRQFLGVMREMSRMMELAHSAEARPGSYDGLGTRHWEPVVTEMPAGRDLLLYFELPEVEVEDMELSLLGNSLEVSGVRQELPSLENVTADGIVSGQLDVGPVWQSTFKREVRLPRPVQKEEVEAAFGAGLLQVRIPGAKENSSRRIHVRGKRRPRKWSK